MNIRHRQDLIIKLMKLHPVLRDDDNKLLAKLWESEFDILAWDIEDFTATNFLNMLADDDFSKPEAVTRCRRKLQEKHPELRGTKYIERHRHQADVINQLNNF